MIRVKQKGNYSKIDKYLSRIEKPIKINTLKRYAQEGVIALMDATPEKTGTTKNSWYYKIIQKEGNIRIEYCNSNINDGVNIAIILQYGHGTGTGGWVEGRDYINPAVQPVFDKIAKKALEEVI